MNKKVSGKILVSKAAKTLKSDNSSNIQKKLAGSVLSQASKNKQTGKEIEGTLTDVLKSDKYNALTKSFAASLLSQSNKSR